MNKKDLHNSKVKEFFSQNDIKYVLFDMDRTLVDTGPYFRKRMFKAILKIVKRIYSKESIDKQIDITSQIQNISTEIFLKDKRPRIVNELTLIAIEKYFNDKKVKYNKIEIENSLEKSFKNFYNLSPSLFPYTVKTLKQIKNSNIKMGVYSHAQYQWTEKKVDKIKNQFRKKYKGDLDLPFYTTDINDLKDSIGWKKAGKHLGFDIEKTLVVGDSLTSDIYPAIDAGYKCLIYLTHSNPIPKIEKNAKVYITTNIGTIFYEL